MPGALSRALGAGSAWHPWPLLPMALGPAQQRQGPGGCSCSFLCSLLGLSRVSLSPALQGLSVTIPTVQQDHLPGLFPADRAQLSHISPSCAPHLSPAPAECSKAGFKQRAVFLNLAAQFQPGGFGHCRLGGPHSYPNCLGTLTFSRLSPFSELHCWNNHPSYFVLHFFSCSSSVCLPTAHLELSIINHSLLPHVHMGFLIHSKSFGEQMQL